MIGTTITRDQSEAIESAYQRIKLARIEEGKTHQAHKAAKEDLADAEEVMFNLCRDIYEPNLFTGEKVDPETGEVQP
jgi:hypothetical protein